MVDEEVASESSNSSGPEIDPEDPMRDYLVAKRKEEKGAKKGKTSKSKNKHKDETPEERRARKERKGKGKSAGMKGVEDLLNSLGGGIAPGDQRYGSVSPRRSRSGSPVRDQDRDNRRLRRSPTRRRSRSHERPPRPTRSPPYHSRDAEDRRQHEREGDSPPRARRGYD